MYVLHTYVYIYLWYLFFGFFQDGFFFHIYMFAQLRIQDERLHGDKYSFPLQSTYLIYSPKAMSIVCLFILSGIFYVDIGRQKRVIHFILPISPKVAKPYRYLCLSFFFFHFPYQLTNNILILVVFFPEYSVVFCLRFYHNLFNWFPNYEHISYLTYFQKCTHCVVLQ